MTVIFTCNQQDVQQTQISNYTTQIQTKMLHAPDTTGYDSKNHASVHAYTHTRHTQIYLDYVHLLRTEQTSTQAIYTTTKT